MNIIFTCIQLQDKVDRWRIYMDRRDMTFLIHSVYILKRKKKHILVSNIKHTKAKIAYILVEIQDYRKR